MGNVGIQLFSVWREAEKDFLGTVKKMADLGYDGIQFAGFFQTPAEPLKKVMDDHGIVAAGSHTGIHLLTGDDFERTLEYNDKIENRLVIVPALPKEMRQTADDYKRTAELLNGIGEKCYDAGFTFGYHNHEFEFNEFDGKTGFDLLFEQTDPMFVKVELDCYWAAFSDHDPLEIIQKYKDRVVSLHMKDMKLVDGKKTGTEIGNGQLDLKSLITIGKQHSVEWFTVEQEEFETDPFEALKINAQNLHAMVVKEG
ncbi:sugar phosphate isomerase/epimerase [Halalkalibacter kiskunsagensis]|uniref:Sugar phosphate isomerase/epimerase n=1 Tax=Halalkalibacter kiskunsagensis TaxID=1548599 RepID=A0ABV6KFN0_9BACI